MISDDSISVPAVRACALVLAALLLAAPTASPAVDEARPEDWKVDLDVHFWIPEHEVTLLTGDELTIGIDDVIQEFDMTLQAGFKARKGRWRLFGDAAYVRLTADDAGSVTVPVGPLSSPTQISAKYQEEAWVTSIGRVPAALERIARRRARAGRRRIEQGRG